MARIAGVDLPRGKQIVIALTYIYGVGKTTAQRSSRMPVFRKTFVKMT